MPGRASSLEIVQALEGRAGTAAISRRALQKSGSFLADGKSLSRLLLRRACFRLGFWRYAAGLVCTKWFPPIAR